MRGSILPATLRRIASNILPLQWVTLYKIHLPHRPVEGYSAAATNCVRRRCCIQDYTQRTHRDMSEYSQSRGLRVHGVLLKVSNVTWYASKE